MRVRTNRATLNPTKALAQRSGPSSRPSEVTMPTMTTTVTDADMARAHVQATLAHYLAERDWFRYEQARRYLVTVMDRA